MNDSFCVSTNHQKHAMRDIYPPFVGIRLQDYHNGLKWLWVGCLDAVAKSRNGQQDRAVEALTRIAAKIVEYDGVFEVYEKDGPPLQRFFYRSEKLFAWSSGLFVWACHQVGVDLSD